MGVCFGDNLYLFLELKDGWLKKKSLITIKLALLQLEHYLVGSVKLLLKNVKL